MKSNISAQCFDTNEHHDGFMKVVKNIGHLLYIVDRKESSYNDSSAVPNYYWNAWPYFILFMFLENLTLWFQTKPTYRLNDTLTSISHGLIQEVGRLIFRGAESYAYVLIYENFHLVDLPWDRAVTWYLAALGVDFCYYWVHRACHEVHILWAQHQVHHSSEEFNLPVGLRQSILQGWCGFVFYLPLALAVPPVQFIAHQHFNLLYQFWIHTSVVESLGYLETIFNTPKHHRVHHGSNIYCLDKNYGGVLIIWDRLFGTFAQERDDEEIIYGLVFNQPSFNPLHLQTFYSIYVLRRYREMNSWKHKLAVLFYGPSWQPGKPRLGLEEDKVKVTARPKYDVQLNIWCKIYICVHFCIVFNGFVQLLARHMAMNAVANWTYGGFFVFTLITIGMLLDGHPSACHFELLRCITVAVMLQRIGIGSLIPGMTPKIFYALEIFYWVSGFAWLLQSSSKVVDMLIIEER